MLEDGDEVARAAPPHVEAVDGTAAGDAFTACLVVSLLEGRGEEEALSRACAAGSLAASRLGAQPSLPTAAEIDAILRRQNPLSPRPTGGTHGCDRRRLIIEEPPYRRCANTPRTRVATFARTARPLYRASDLEPKPDCDQPGGQRAEGVQACLSGVALLEQAVGVERERRERRVGAEKSRDDRNAHP